ncbi:MAG: threonylcarbamoyl-AMP synthase, partial [Meiothermus sp.]
MAVLPPTPENLALAADVIRTGGLVAFPTETVYGLGANALNAEAATKIFAAKRRPSFDPLIVHVADRAMLAKVAQEIPSQAEKLIETFWPGPLTLVLPKSADVPGVVTSGLPTVAVRVPSHP